MLLKVCITSASRRNANDVLGISKAPSIKKVLVIWNNQKKLPPPNEEWPKISVKIVIIKTTKNVLSNRFYPYDGKFLVMKDFRITSVFRN